MSHGNSSQICGFAGQTLVMPVVFLFSGSIIDVNQAARGVHPWALELPTPPPLPSSRPRHTRRPVGVSRPPRAPPAATRDARRWMSSRSPCRRRSPWRGVPLSPGPPYGRRVARRKRELGCGVSVWWGAEVTQGRMGMVWVSSDVNTYKKDIKG